MSTQTTTRLATLPRVNLLPPEIEQQRRFRHVQAGLGGAVLASVVVVGALLVSANGQVGSAQGDLDANKAQATKLQLQADAYKEVPLVQAQVDAARAQLGLAMGQEVRWSYFLNDLSLKIPRHVWLDSMIVTQTSSAATAGVAPAVGTYPAVGIGTVTFSGRAYKHNDVAAWLNSLARQKGYSQPYFTDSTTAPLGTNDKAVTFASQVTVTDDALSKRYTEKAGN
jgi:Tfp pilus assembly protein PilN